MSVVADCHGFQYILVEADKLTAELLSYMILCKPTARRWSDPNSITRKQITTMKTQPTRMGINSVFLN